MIEVPQGLIASPRFWHDPAGMAWLDRLPALVETTCADWGLRVDGAPRHGSHALVIPVAGDTGPAVLRLTPPDARAAEDLRALRFWADGPVVGVLRAAEDGSALLLERLDVDLSLATRPPDEVAEVLGGLVAALAVTDPPQDASGTAGAASDLAVDDEGLAVNGDLHADQVLRDPAGAWRVVDPQLMRGDPAYDLARAVWTTVDRLPDAGAILGFTDRLVGATGLDRSRAEAWLIVRTVAYWLWCLETGLTEDPVRCARFVAAFADD